jgi:hypothetical protein
MSSRSLAFAVVATLVSCTTTDASADESAAPIRIAPPSRGVALVMEILFGRSFHAISHGRELAIRGMPDLRQPQWTGLEPPRPPALYVRLVRITF